MLYFFLLFVIQKKDVQNQISAYTKLLNIKIDEKEEDPSDPEVEEWTKCRAD